MRFLVRVVSLPPYSEVPPSQTYLWLVGNGGMGYNYNYYYYHSSIPYEPKVGKGAPTTLNF